MNGKVERGERRFEDRGQGKEVGYLFVCCGNVEVRERQIGGGRERERRAAERGRKEYCAVTSYEQAWWARQSNVRQGIVRTEGTAM